MGKRCYGTYNWNAKSRKNVVAALCESSIIGCGIIEDNIDTNVFNTWVEKILIPDLPSKSVIVMDNATFHKSEKTKALLENEGHILNLCLLIHPISTLLSINGLKLNLFIKN